MQCVAGGHQGAMARLAKDASMKHDAWLKEQLQDPGFAAEYLAAAAQDAEPAVHLAALRKVAESRGMAKVAVSAGSPRESLSRALSARGNPR